MSEHEALLNLQSNDAISKGKAIVPLIYALLAAIAPLLFGYTLGYTSPIGDDLRNDLDLTEAQTSLFGSMVNVGAMIGSLIGGQILDLIGRRWTIFACTPPFAGGFALIWLSHDFGVAIAGRLLTGVGVGLASLSVPVYISEIAPPHLRGGMGTINQLAVTIGVLVSYALGMGLKWRVLALIAVFPAGALAVLTFFFPSSPRWLYKRGRHDKAAQTITKLRGAEFNVDAEMFNIKKAADADAAAAEATLMDVFRGGSGRAMVIALLLMVYQQFSGVNVVIFYSGKIFTDAGSSNSNASALIVSAVQVVVTLLSISVIDKAGRRVLLMVAGIGMAAACLVLAYFFYEKNGHDDPSGTMAVVAVIVYIACFGMGLGAIPWLMMSEIFPSRVRGRASSIAVLVNWSCSFIVTETFQPMINALTEEGVFVFYALVCVGGVLFVLFKVPETKGRELEELERFFAGDKHAGDQHIDGAGTGGALVKIASLLALLYLGLNLLLSNI